MPIAPALLHFIDDELARAPALIDRIRADTLQRLRTGRDIAPAAAERANALAAAEALQMHASAYERGCLDAWREGVRETLHERQGQGSPETPGLELMDEARVEIDIEISRAIQLIDTVAEWELRELQTYTSTLVGDTHVSAESNPFRPQVIAGALWQAACAATPVPVQRTALLRASSAAAAGLMKNAWAAACTRLESQGIEPGVYRSIVLNAGSATGRGLPLPDVDNPSTLAGLLASMPGGSAGMRVSVANAAVAMGTTSPHATVGPLDHALDQALARLDELLRVAAPNPDAQARAQALRAPHAQLAENAQSVAQRQVIELVWRVFDAIDADTSLPPAYTAVLRRLRVSALRVALRDSAMPGTTRHPVWQLLDRIGELAQAAPPPGDTRATTLLARCNALANQLANAARPDATLYERELRQLDALLASQFQAQLQAAQGSVQGLDRAERRELLAQHLAQRLTEQMANMRPSASVRRFVTGTWSRVLADTIVRDGEQAETTRAYVKVVDDLLWSVQLPDHPQSRQRLIGLLPGLLKRLRDGMASIAVPAAEQQRVLDELMTIHTESLKPTSRPQTRALSPEEIVQRMREEVLPPSTGHGAFRDSLIDLATLETVPAELLNGAEQTPAEDPRQSVAALRVGVRLRLFIRGRWNRVQLLWRSDKGEFFLFAGEAVARTHSVTRPALERLSGAGLVRPLELRTLVQRALETVMRDLGRTT